jgi:hypothetical protein
VALVVSLLAALAYSSWPVAYLVNPSLAATALASELEARGQPYSWLFISLDCLTGVAALVVARLAWPKSGSTNDHRLVRVILIGYAMFGVATAVDSLVPVACSSVTLSSCGVDVRHLNSDDWLTAISVFALFVAVCGGQLRVARLRAWKPFAIGSFFIALIWTLSGPIFLVVSLSTRHAHADGGSGLHGSGYEPVETNEARD